MKNKSTVSVYTRNGHSVGSSYYRILQYFDEIDEYEIKYRITASENLTKSFIKADDSIIGKFVKVRYYLSVYMKSLFYMLFDLISKPNVLVFLRSVTPKTYLGPLKCIYKRLVKSGNVLWDFDDNIIVSNEISKEEFMLLSKYSLKISVTNDELRQLVPKQYRQKVCLLPTTDGDFRRISLDDVKSERSCSFDHTINIVWVGSAANIQYVNMVLEALDKAAFEIKKQFNKKTVLRVVCNSKVTQKTKYLIIENVQWSRDVAIEVMKASHIGIMPLIDSEFTRGKGGFKIVQYYALGIPAIASSVGFNKEIITDKADGILLDDKNGYDIWADAVLDVITSKEQWISMSNMAHKKWKDAFNYEKNLKYWRDEIKEVCM